MSSTTQRCSRLQHGYCIGVSRRSAQATVGKGLGQGPYMAARAGVEPTTFRLKVIDSTKAPPCPKQRLYLEQVVCRISLLYGTISHDSMKLLHLIKLWLRCSSWTPAKSTAASE